MKNLLPFIFFYILLQSCNSGIPKEILQPDKMEKVLFDIHVIDGYLGTISKADSAKRVAASYYKGVFNKFKIDSATYNKSMNYYYKHPVELNKIYGNLAKTFAKENERLNNQIAVEVLPQDFINTSIIYKANIPVANAKPKIGTTPFEFSLSLSRY